ncbi:MAG: nicotinate phosphoribosyltransferase [Bryobacteraceae bacterium]
MNGLLTDLYQLTMAAGYFMAGKSGEKATFELFVRRLPEHRGFLVAAGLAQAVDYLINFSITSEEVDYLRGLPQFRHVPPAFFEMLAGLRFTGDLFAMREGTPFFPGEPVLTVRAPLIEAQIAETFLLSIVGFQTMIASKAARVVESAGGRAVIEFGTRRAHSPEAGVLAGRAAYIGGCLGTSNTLTGFRYGVPVFGTSAHSWVMSFESETEAFRQLQSLLGEGTIYLIDSYDTLEGARKAVELGKPLWGVRLDSGNLVELSRAVRRILDDGGFHEARIMATGDLNEYKILELVAAGAPIDVFGVGTDLATSSDAPSLGVVYKIVQLETEGGRRYTAKFSEDKQTIPGAKQVFRFPDRDRIGLSADCGGAEAEPLLRPVILNGALVEPLPTAQAARDHAAASLRKLPSACRGLFPSGEAWPVEVSEELLQLAEHLRPRFGVFR